MFSRTLGRISLAQVSRPLVALPRLAIASTLPRSFTTSTINFNQTTQTQAASAPVTSQITQDLTPLKLEGDLYAVVRVHSNPFLVTVGDKMVLPFNLKTAQVGDVLNFHDVTTIGSRNYTLTDSPIDPAVYTIKGVVLEKTKLPMRVREITKRRQRKVRHAISKPERTIVRVTEISLK
ncbi:CYFA0S07e02938g1_1 [Cyberlindnera fabianii]|uniref:Large ribosomal subunit protein bL21m n=1 Tax=Cyberlindnera fabianii TaxID=36022 RepID=A0A061B1M3_CYBFA|nr:Homocitrate dehydratase, mitochondrial [Cyberlindnera fabianii]CDR41500.1 CYFA0S07e02938g1_1 [Cyberlindnera fabianii]